MASYPDGTELSQAEIYEHLHDDEENRTVDTEGDEWRVVDGKLEINQNGSGFVPARWLECEPHRAHGQNRAQLASRCRELEARNQQLEAAIRAAAELVTR